MSFRIGVIFVILIVLVGCNARMSPAEADRSMKMLNGNLSGFLTTASEKPELQAMYFLFRESSSPLCLKQQSDTVPVLPEKKKGRFYWSAQRKQFEKHSPSDSIALYFPFDGENGDSVFFLMPDFDVRSCKSRPDFPVRAKASLRVGERVLSIDHAAAIEDNLPLTIDTEVKGNDYSAEFLLRRSKNGENGDLVTDFSIQTKGFTVASGEMNATIGYSRTGYFFRFIQFSLALMDHQIEGTIDYSKIDPTSSDYASSFNANSTIRISESGEGEVGTIVLGRSGEGELLDFFVRYSDGQQVLLSQHVPLLKKVLDFKYD